VGSFFLMIRNFLVVVFCFAVGIDFASASSLTLDENEIDFGEKFQFAHLVHELKVWNTSKTSTVVFQTDSNRDGTSIQATPEILGPQQSGMVRIELSLSDHLGYLGKRIQLRTEEDGTQQTYPVVFMGYVNSILDDAETGVDFGPVDTNTGAERDVAFSSSIVPKLQVTQVLEAPEFVHLTILSSGKGIRLATKKSSVLGYRKGVVKVALNSVDQPQAWINVLADFRGDIVPDQNPLSFGVQRPSSLHSIRLQLRSRTESAFSIEHFEVSPTAHVDIRQVSCLPAPSKSCSGYELIAERNRAQGQIEGEATFKVAGSPDVLHVLLQGIFFNDSTNLQPLEKISAAQASVTKKTDIVSELSKATNPMSDAVPAGFGPLLKWKIANESAIYGYAIYRGESAEGVFKRINEKLIRAKNNGDNEEVLYQYRDTTAKLQHEYWYYITIFYNSGKKVQLTGPQKVVAK
jgi:hypothetical protein